MVIERDEFLTLLTRAQMTYAQLGRRIGRAERTVSDWGGRKKGGVPDRYEAVVRDALAVGGEPSNPLAAYSDYALMDELASRLRRLRGEVSSLRSRNDSTNETWINADSNET